MKLPLHLDDALSPILALRSFCLKVARFSLIAVVAELQHIARPGISLHGAQSGRRDFKRFEPAIPHSQQKLTKRRNVPHPLPQRRHSHRQRAERVKQILPEHPSPHRLGRIDPRGREPPQAIASEREGIRTGRFLSIDATDLKKPKIHELSRPMPFVRGSFLTKFSQTG